MPEYKSLPVDQLQTFERNPRRGDVAAIAESLARRGQYRPIVVNAGSHTGRANEVLAGNHTLLAARRLGWSSIDVSLVDVDTQAAAEIVAADNRLADLGDYDSAALHDLLASLDSLEGTGYLESDLDRLHRELFPPEPLTDPDDAPPVPDAAVSEVGQVWELGGHRLLVGDATDRTLVGGLFSNRGRADAVWTDPPYGVDYVGGTKRKLRIRNDTAEGLAGLLTAAFGVVSEVCRPGAPVYVAHADTKRMVFEQALVDAGLRVRQNLVWVKNSLVMGRSDYQYRHEPILAAEVLDDEAAVRVLEHEPILFTDGGEGRLGRGGAWWFGDNKAQTVFEVDKPPRNADHPTMKPVALIDAMLTNSLPPDGVVFDPFAGSGSTLIAAHGRQARCYAVELDPRYADVILRRFEAHTGIVPTLGGQPRSFVEAA